MAQRIEYLTAETEPGRQALAEVMGHSYRGDLELAPPAWARVRLADGVPVSYIVVDPERQLDMPAGSVRYAFILDVATREDRRGEGHFRGIMEDTFAAVRAAGVSLVITHGRYPLYRRFSFEVFTHHSGIFVTPEQIERKLGPAAPAEAEELLVIEDRPGLQEGLLLVVDVKARTLSECQGALRAAAGLARQRVRTCILFEHPAAPSYGSHYPIYPSPETLFTTLARACGAEWRLQGADPEGGTIPDADWIKVLDAAGLLREVLPCLDEPAHLPEATVCLASEAGQVTLSSAGSQVTVSAETPPGAQVVRWPAGALAQLVTGYQSAEVLDAIHGTALSAAALGLLGALFRTCWRFSRNESWTFKS